MGKTVKRAQERKVSSSYFLECFGFSRKIYSDKGMVEPEEDGERKIKTKKKKPNRWLLCSKFRSKNREIKPAPIEETEKPTSSVEDKIYKKKPLNSCMSDRKNIPADDKSVVNHDTKETKPKDLQVVTTERLGSSREDTCPERISNSTRNVKPEMKQMKPSREKSGSRVEKFDPVIGISVIVLTLVIMLVWGRLCAILCTSAWCYLLPRLRDAAALAKRKRSGSDSSAYVQDLNSESYKRKVVMDGFLGRQNRVSLS
ncbi:unnamed protein product [Eruca vesicaria subsp. sativa]|uniref:Transmembrane protein n=1 Tax=Eruca vesicaria subsp. sativa TaxID=29727 RepID=A0ABC8INE4_ERUVS|nr:unnamed protein product [Eruca vesicaria subsp. sativa]